MRKKKGSEEKSVSISLKGLPLKPIKDNKLTSRNWLLMGLISECPKIDLPVWTDIDAILQAFAQEIPAQSRLDFQKDVASSIFPVHCSAYLLAATVNKACDLMSNSRRLSDSTSSSSKTATVPSVKQFHGVDYKQAPVSSGRVIDLQDMYAIEIDFQVYWGAIIITPTEWSVMGDKKILVARSAWGSARIRITTGDLLVVRFDCPIRSEPNINLFGKATLVHFNRAYDVEREKLKIAPSSSSTSDPAAEADARDTLKAQSSGDARTEKENKDIRKVEEKPTGPIAERDDTDSDQPSVSVQAVSIQSASQIPKAQPVGQTEKLHLCDMIWQGRFSGHINEADKVHITFNSIAAINETILTLAEKCLKDNDIKAISAKKEKLGTGWGGRKPHEFCHEVFIRWRRAETESADSECELGLERFVAHQFRETLPDV